MTFLSAFETASCQHQVNKCKLTCHHIHIMLARVGQLVVNGTFHTTTLYRAMQKFKSSHWGFLGICKLEYLLQVIRRKCVFCLCNCKILWLLSIIVIVCASVKSTNVVCPHNGSYDLCTFAIFLENMFSGHNTFVLQTTNKFL